MWQKEDIANDFIKKLFVRESKTIYGQRELCLGKAPEFTMDLSNNKTYSKLGLYKVYVNKQNNRVCLYCDFRFLRQLEEMQCTEYYIPTNSELYILNDTGLDSEVFISLPENLKYDKLYLDKSVSLSNIRIYKGHKFLSCLLDMYRYNASSLNIYSGSVFDFYNITINQKRLSILEQYNIKFRGQNIQLKVSNMNEALCREFLNLLHRTSVVSYNSLSKIVIKQDVSYNDRMNVEWLYKLINACKLYMKYTTNTVVELDLKDEYNMVDEGYKNYIKEALYRYDITIPLNIEVSKE